MTSEKSETALYKTIKSLSKQPNLADYYAERLEFHKKSLGLAGYNQLVFKLAQIDVAKWKKGLDKTINDGLT